MSRVGLTISDHKQYKMRFLSGIEWQQSQYGPVDLFVRHGRQEVLYGIVGSLDSRYHDKSYAEIRGWQVKALETI